MSDGPGKEPQLSTRSLSLTFGAAPKGVTTLFSRKTLFALMAVVFALAAATPSLAGKGSGATSTTASITLNQPAAARTTTAWPTLGSAVDFTTTYPRQTKNPRIEIRCYDAAGALVYAEAGDAGHTFTLGGYSSMWTANPGSASCTARLFDLIWNGNNPQEVVWLASTSFDAAV
jgi:hypothetical protein